MIESVQIVDTEDLGKEHLWLIISSSVLILAAAQRGTLSLTLRQSTVKTNTLACLLCVTALFPSNTNVSTAKFFPVRPASPFLDSLCHHSAILTFNFSPVVLDADWSTGWRTLLFPQTKPDFMMQYLLKMFLWIFWRMMIPSCPDHSPYPRQSEWLMMLSQDRSSCTVSAAHLGQNTPELQFYLDLLTFTISDSRVWWNCWNCVQTWSHACTIQVMQLLRSIDRGKNV